MSEPARENLVVSMVRTSGLDAAKAEIILANFQEYAAIAADWEAKAKTIVVTSPTQVAEMKTAREGRLVLRGKRTAIETIRKNLKEQSLREGKTIDGIAGTLRALIEPIEEYLEKQERFVEIQEEARIKALVTNRASEIIQYGGNPNLFNLGAMNEAEYQSTLISVKQAEEDKLEAEARAILKTAEDRRETERIRVENSKLRVEAMERDRLAQQATEEARRALDAERKERERLEAEDRARKDAEAATLRRNVAEQKRLARAPDKKKLELWADDLDAIVQPDVKSDEAHQVADHVVTKIKALVQWVRDQVEGL